MKHIKLTGVTAGKWTSFKTSVDPAGNVRVWCNGEEVPFEELPDSNESGGLMVHFESDISTDWSRHT